MKYRIVVTVDYNDGDHTTEINDISKQELDDLRPLFQLLEGKHHNFPSGDQCHETDDPRLMYPAIDPNLIDGFELNYCPYCEYGFHTVEKVTVTPWVEVERLV